MSSTLVFTLATVPDTAGLRTLYATGDSATPAQLAEIAHLQSRQTGGNDALPNHLQRIAAISCVLYDHHVARIWSLGKAGDSEVQRIRALFETIKQHKPDLVAWDGSAFEIPVLHCRALIHALPLPKALCMDATVVSGVNLMQSLAPNAAASLDALARLCGFPGQTELDSNAVWAAFQADQLADIQQHCETGAVNTGLLHLRRQYICGDLSVADYNAACKRIHAALNHLDTPYWRAFMARWSSIEI
jgi:predicted PolB exonuclease-like 3'-5' exonuclease